MPAKKTTTAAEKTAAAKPAAKTAKTKEPDEKIFIEYAGGQINVSDILSDIRAASSAAGVDVDSVAVYIKPEESAAYYVVNGKSEGKKIELHF